MEKDNRRVSDFCQLWGYVRLIPVFQNIRVPLLRKAQESEILKLGKHLQLQMVCFLKQFSEHFDKIENPSKSTIVSPPLLEESRIGLFDGDEIVSHLSRAWNFPDLMPVFGDITISILGKLKTCEILDLAPPELRNQMSLFLRRLRSKNEDPQSITYYVDMRKTNTQQVQPDSALYRLQNLLDQFDKQMELNHLNVNENGAFGLYLDFSGSLVHGCELKYITQFLEMIDQNNVQYLNLSNTWALSNFIPKDLNDVMHMVKRFVIISERFNGMDIQPRHTQEIDLSKFICVPVDKLETTPWQSWSEHYKVMQDCHARFYTEMYVDSLEPWIDVCCRIEHYDAQKQENNEQKIHEQNVYVKNE